MMTTKKTSKTSAKYRQKKAKLKENELFAILGRYVQEFERVVTTLRNDCIECVVGEGRGIAINQGLAKLAHDRICSLAFHHEVMTARPIAELWCGLIYEQAHADMNLTPETKKVIYGVSKTIAGDFQELAQTRNRLLHASWNIGTWYKPETFEFQFSVRKFKSGLKGFEERGDLPRNANELSKCLLEITELKNRVSNFNSYRRFLPEQLGNFYAKIKGGRWEGRKT